MTTVIATVIAQSTRIRGRILGATDIEIHGQIEGDLQASGEVVIEAGALVLANVDAARIVVRGSVRGNLSASETLLLEDGAKVIGELRGARIAIADSAQVRGYVETSGSAGAARPAARRAEAQRPVHSTPAARPVVKAAPAPVAKPTPAPAARPAPAPMPVAKKPKVAPAPVVPVLKKTKAVHKSKRA